MERDERVSGRVAGVEGRWEVWRRGGTEGIAGGKGAWASECLNGRRSRVSDSGHDE